MKVRPDFAVTSPSGSGVTHGLLTLMNLIWNRMFIAIGCVPGVWAMSVSKVNRFLFDAVLMLMSGHPRSRGLFNDLSRREIEALMGWAGNERGAR